MKGGDLMPVVSAISSLKRIIATESAVDPLEQYLMESTDDRIRDAILDDINFSLLGAETDKSLDAMINKIVPYSDEDPDMEKKVEQLTESVIVTEFE